MWFECNLSNYICPTTYDRIFNFLKIFQKIPQASSGAKIELERVKIDLDEYQAKMCKKLRVLRENSKEKRKL